MKDTRSKNVDIVTRGFDFIVPEMPGSEFYKILERH